MKFIKIHGKRDCTWHLLASLNSSSQVGRPKPEQDVIDTSRFSTFYCLDVLFR